MLRMSKKTSVILEKKDGNDQQDAQGVWKEADRLRITKIDVTASESVEGVIRLSCEKFLQN